MALKTEKIMVIPTKKITGDRLTIPYNETTEFELIDMFNLGEFQTRWEMETDTSFKQLIPYVLVVNEKDEYLIYQRSSKGGEDRLHANYSIGIGGHIDKDENLKTCADNYFSSLTREVEEELGIKTKPDEYEFKATLYNDADSVGQVHLGLFSILKVNSNQFNLDGGETDILVNREFVSGEDLILRYTTLERWSQLVVDNL